MSITLPDLAEIGAQYQNAMRPDDAQFGAGNSDWSITYEWDPDPKSTVTGGPIWGCMCSPSILEKEGVRAKLAPEDIAAKRAHIVVRLPKNQKELDEVPRTMFHENGHVLLASLNLPRDKEEEIMHSLDSFVGRLFSKLSPEQAMALARSFQDPMARAYRAETTAMPDPIEDPKKPDKEAPKMQEGAPRDAAAINADIANADPNDASLLAKLAMELRQALIAKAVEPIAGNGPASEPSMPEAPTMGMKPEDAYNRGKKEAEAKATKDAVKAYAASIEGITEEQRAEIADAPSMERAQRLLKTYPRQTAATLGALPGKIPGAKPAQTVLERAMTADDDVMARVRRASSDDKTGGLILDIPGHSVGWSPSHWLKEELGKHERRMKAQQEAGR